MNREGDGGGISGSEISLHSCAHDWVRPPYRSPAPDLLFEDECASRVAELGMLRDDPKQVTARTPLHRITMFLTYRCQLACTYCKTIARDDRDLADNPRKAAVIGLTQCREMLASHEGTPIRHIHYTGGEALLHPDMPEMVRAARLHGALRQSVTSNGALPIKLYENIIESGIDEIRISIDADDPDLGAALSKRPHAWRKTIETIRHLAALRDRGAGFFLILNTVVTLDNRRNLHEIVRFLLALRPNDIKLITSVDEKLSLGDFPEAGREILAIRSLLEPFPQEAFPLLRRKLDTVFQPETIGLEALANDSYASTNADWRCYIPLTERTVDGQSYYPCSVYLREGGAPLGDLADPQDVQRARSADFVMRGDCRDDPICQNYCLHCTREYNRSVNRARLSPTVHS